MASLTRAFAGCDTVAHLAGINREIGEQTYQRVHIEGTANVIAAARAAGVRRIVMLSFLRARPDCGSPYHESKWEAEEMIRASGLQFTIVKAGVIYGRGDHLLDHLSHALFTLYRVAGITDLLAKRVGCAEQSREGRGSDIGLRKLQRGAQRAGRSSRSFGDCALVSKSPAS